MKDHLDQLEELSPMILDEWLCQAAEEILKKYYVYFEPENKETIQNEQYKSDI